MKTIWQTSNRVGGGVLFVNTTVTDEAGDNEGSHTVKWTCDKTLAEITAAKMCFINAPGLAYANATDDTFEVYPAIFVGSSLHIILPDFTAWQDGGVETSSYDTDWGVISFMPYGEDEEHLVAYVVYGGIL